MVKAKSILPDEFNGCMFFGGLRGTGKSFLAAQAENPKLVAFFDFDEEKGLPLHRSLGFGHYVSITTEAVGEGPLGWWNRMKAEIDKLPANQFTVAIIDNVSPMELGMLADVKANPPYYAKRYGMQAESIVKGQYGADRGVVNYLISEAISSPLHAKGIRLIIVTAHVKPDFRKVGKMNIKGADRWHEIGILTLILDKPDFPPIPSALVFKEMLGEMKFDEETGIFSPRRRMPERLPRATFAEIKRYLQEPADLDNPAPGERPTPQQFAPFTEEMTNEQIALMRAQAELELAQMKQSTGTVSSGGIFSKKQDETETRIKEMIAEGKNDAEIAKELSVGKMVVKNLREAEA